LRGNISGMSTASKWLILTIGSAIGAFPIAGAIWGLAYAISEKQTGGTIGGYLYELIIGAIVTCETLGHSYDKHWNRISLYPWIMGTWLMLFLAGALLLRLINLKSLRK
jgi:hypothetical protein